MDEQLNPSKRTARFAGFLYLLLVIIFPYGLIYVPALIVVKGDAAATAQNLLTHEFLFRSSIVGDLIAQVIFVLLVLVLYQLLKPVNEHRARFMVALVFIGVPIAFIGDVFKISSLMILKGYILQSTGPAQMYDLVAILLSLGSSCTQTVQLYWGLWLLPFGLLVYRSGFFPRILGILLILNGIAYIILCLTFLLLPDLQTIMVKFVTPFLILELPIVLWLLIKGVRTKPEINKV